MRWTNGTSTLVPLVHFVYLVPPFPIVPRHDGSSSLAHTNNSTPRQRWPSVPTERNRNRGPPRLALVDLFVLFSFPFPFLWALHFFIPVIRPNETTTKFFDFNSCLHWSLSLFFFSFFLFPYFFPLTQ